MSEFKVVNPATNETEREFAAATDAEVELETGMVWINSPTGSIADLPFGGTKAPASAGNWARPASTSS